MLPACRSVLSVDSGRGASDEGEAAFSIVGPEGPVTTPTFSLAWTPAGDGFAYVYKISSEGNCGNDVEEGTAAASPVELPSPPSGAYFACVVTEGTNLAATNNPFAFQVALTAGDEGTKSDTATKTGTGTGTGTGMGSTVTAEPPVLSTITPSLLSHRGGTLLTLSGADFADGVTVMIGDQPCDSVTRVSSAQITCVAPKTLPGMVDVTVKNPDDQTSVLEDALTIRSFFYVMNQNGASVSGFAADPVTGQLTPTPGSPYTAGTNVTHLIFTPDRRFLYAASYDGGKVSAYAVDPSTGALTALAGSPFAVGDPGSNWSAMTPDGKFLFTTNQSGGTVTTFSIGSDGTLAVVSSYNEGDRPFFGTVEATGRFLYVADIDFNRVHAYKIAANGTLSVIAGSPYALPGFPMTMKTDPLGRYLIVQHDGPEGLKPYAIDATTGSLTARPITGGSSSQAGTVFTDNFDLDWATGDVYLPQSGSTLVNHYTVDLTTGDLTSAATTSAGAGPSSIALSPTGKVVAVPNNTDGTLSLLRRNADGSLSAASPAAAAGGGAYFAAFDSSGRFVYVVNSAADSVSAFRVDDAAATLTPVSPASYAVGQFPLFILEY